LAAKSSLPVLVAVATMGAKNFQKVVATNEPALSEVEWVNRPGSASF
jgi:hypothetical protein